MASLLLLSIAIAVLWVRSYFITDEFKCARHSGNGSTSRESSVTFRSGGIVFQDFRITGFSSAPSAPKSKTEFSHVRADTPTAVYPALGHWYEDGQHRKRFGFEWQRDSRSAGSISHTFVGLIVPFWFLLLMALTFPAIVVSRHISRRRSARGFPVQPTEPH